MKVRILAIVAAVALGSAALAEPLNVLFYGNSFTIAQGFGSTRSVNAVFRDIAVAAGHEQPYVISGSVAGQSLAWHLSSNTSLITTSIAAGKKWDYVVLQDYSTQPTHVGNLALHRSSYVGLFQAVRNHSPQSKAIGFETWARAPGHSFYLGNPPAFPGGPAQMQQELRDGYALSTADALAAFGPGSSRVAPVGTAWENANWQGLHGGDLYHAQNRGTLLAALVIYATVYDDDTVGDTNLAGVLASLGLSAADGQFLTSVADATVPEAASFGGALLAFATFLRRR